MGHFQTQFLEFHDVRIFRIRFAESRSGNFHLIGPQSSIRASAAPRIGKGRRYGGTGAWALDTAWHDRQLRRKAKRIWATIPWSCTRGSSHWNRANPSPRDARIAGIGAGHAEIMKEDRWPFYPRVRSSLNRLGRESRQASRLPGLGRGHTRPGGADGAADDSRFFGRGGNMIARRIVRRSWMYPTKRGDANSAVGQWRLIDEID